MCYDSVIATNQTGVTDMEATYKIIRAEATTHTGRCVIVWDVVDAADGYVYDTFSRKCDAKDWIARATA